MPQQRTINKLNVCCSPSAVLGICSARWMGVFPAGSSLAVDSVERLAVQGDESPRQKYCGGTEEGFLPGKAPQGAA